MPQTPYAYVARTFRVYLGISCMIQLQLTTIQACCVNDTAPSIVADYQRAKDGATKIFCHKNEHSSCIIMIEVALPCPESFESVRSTPTRMPLRPVSVTQCSLGSTTMRLHPSLITRDSTTKIFVAARLSVLLSQDRALSLHHHHHRGFLTMS